MTFEPQKFFIGLMEFFSILLPGALLTYLLMGKVGPGVLGAHRYATLAGAEAWAVFLFASYLLGHMVFLLSSWLDEFYDWARCHTLNTQITLLAHRDRLLHWLARGMIWLVFKRERNLAVDSATRIKHQALGALQAKDAVNTFQWSKALLNADSPASLAVVERFEADSKFFRSFTFVLLVLLIVGPWQDYWSLAAIPVILGLLLLALWRYMEQRHKATNHAYWFVLTLTAKHSKITLDKPSPAENNQTRIGGVVFRTGRGKVEYLLVEDKNGSAKWVVPKGYMEAGKSHRETAVRAVYENTGVWACICQDLGDVACSVDGSTAHFFLMQAIGRGKRQGRNHWLTLPKDSKDRSHIETCEWELLQVAEQRRSCNCGSASDTHAAPSTST